MRARPDVQRGGHVGRTRAHADQRDGIRRQRRRCCELLSAGVHCLCIGCVKRLCAFFRQARKCWVKGCDAIWMALQYLAAVLANYFILARTRCDPEDVPPSCFRMALPALVVVGPLALFLCLPRSFLLTLSFSLCLPGAFRLLLLSPRLSLKFFVSFSFCLPGTFGLLILSLRPFFQFLLLPVLRLPRPLRPLVYEPAAASNYCCYGRAIGAAECKGGKDYDHRCDGLPVHIALWRRRTCVQTARLFQQTCAVCAASHARARTSACSLIVYGGDGDLEYPRTPVIISGHNVSHRNGPPTPPVFRASSGATMRLQDLDRRPLEQGLVNSCGTVPTCVQ
jgi:hypothetical protein